jgi:3-methylcrotonyl-CoA carboxylase alpha subunit
MLAKLIVWAEDREAALSRMARALHRFEIAGVTTNLSFLQRLVTHPAVQSNDIDTNFIERELAHLTGMAHAPGIAVLGAAVAAILIREQEAALPDPADPYSPWDLRTGWMAACERRRLLRFRDPNDGTHDVSLRYTRQGLRIDVGTTTDVALSFDAGELETDVFLDSTKTKARFAWSGDELVLWASGERHRLNLVDPYATEVTGEALAGRITSPMPGVVTRILAEVDVLLERNAPVLTMEAMKVVHTLKAPTRGRIIRLRCAVGDQVPEGVDLVDFEVVNSLESNAS